MDCSCIKGNFNCYTEAIDTETIIYQDLSDWMQEEGYIDATEYSVNVTPPASFAPKTLVLKIGQINRLTSSELGSVKDGVYCFEVTSCGVSYKRSKAIFPHLSCCIKKAWATLGVEWHDKIREVEKHLKLATNNAEMDNVKTATRELNIANKLLENIKCDCDCR